MNQTAFQLDVAPSQRLDRASAAVPQSDADRLGFDIGWDHAHHGLVPPAELLLDGTPLGQGWRAGKAVFGRRSAATQRSTRQWLALRTLAWRRGIAFEPQRLSAHELAQCHVDRCPVLRVLLTRYLVRELLATLLVVTTVLLLASIGARFLDYLSEVAQGALTFGALWQVLALRLPLFAHTSSAGLFPERGYSV